MTLRHMIIFRTVCETDFNLTKAAEVLHMSQPAVSLAIKELEQYYGICLFDRIGRRLQITDVGRQFRQYAIHISDTFKDMDTVLKDWGTNGTLRVGASITIGSQFLPDYVKTFSGICPGINVFASVEPVDILEKKLLLNEIDCALTEGPVHDKNLIEKPYLEDHLSIICSAEKGWKRGQVISLEELGKQKFLLRERGSGTRDVFDRVMAQAGISVEPIWEAMSTTALVNAVVNNIGIAVLPHRMVLPALKKGIIIEVRAENLSFRRNFYIVYHKDKFLTDAAKKFIDLCENYENDYPFPKYNGLY